MIFIDIDYEERSALPVTGSAAPARLSYLIRWRRWRRFQAGVTICLVHGRHLWHRAASVASCAQGMKLRISCRCMTSMHCAFSLAVETWSTR